MSGQGTSPSISVAMATYNGAPFIAEQLASIAGQTRLPDEIVVSDDGSTDDTLGAIERFARTAPFPVRVLPPHPQLGFADNFLHAAAHCQGDLVAFCDQDDWWLPGKLAQAAARIAADDSLIALHPLIVTDGALVPTGWIWSQEIDADRVIEPLALDPYNTGFGNTMTFRREVLGVIARDRRPVQPERPDRPLAHDHWIYALCAALGRVSYIKEPLIRYRQHGSNTYGVKPRPWTNRVYSAFAVPEERFRQEAAFDTHMAGVFAEIGAGTSRWAAAARTAEAVFRQRAFLCEQRLGTYNGSGLLARATAFRNSRSVPFYRPSLKSSVKELVLGVSGLSRQLRRIGGEDPAGRGAPTTG